MQANKYFRPSLFVVALMCVSSGSSFAQKSKVTESDLKEETVELGAKSLDSKGEAGADESSVASAESPASATSANSATPELLAVDFKYDDPAKEFLIQVPSDWGIQKDYAGYAVFAEPKVKDEPTAENPVAADPTLTVAVARNPMPIDLQSLEEYAKEMNEKFKVTNGAGSEMQIFQKNLIDNLPGGKKGLLYYLTYKKNGYDVVSAVLVRSNETAMYRVTLTDYKVGFDKNLERYYPIMASLSIAGDAPVRQDPWQVPLQVAGAAGGILVFLVGAKLLMNRRVKREMDEVISGADSDTARSGSVSMIPLEDNDNAPRRKRKEAAPDSTADLEEMMYKSAPPKKAVGQSHAFSSAGLSSANSMTSSPQSSAASSSADISFGGAAPSSAVHSSVAHSNTAQFSAAQSIVVHTNAGHSVGALSNAGQSGVAQSVAFPSGFNAADSQFASKPLSETFPFDSEMMEDKSQKKKKEKDKKEKKASTSVQDEDDFPLSDIGLGKQ